MLRLFTRLAGLAGLALAASSALAQSHPPLGLKPGKPFAGQTVRVLAVETPQFQGLQLRDAEFTQLTGIKVEWNFTPFRALQEKIAAVLYQQHQPTAVDALEQAVERRDL